MFSRPGMIVNTSVMVSVSKKHTQHTVRRIVYSWLIVSPVSMATECPSFLTIAVNKSGLEAKRPQTSVNTIRWEVYANIAQIYT